MGSEGDGQGGGGGGAVMPSRSLEGGGKRLALMKEERASGKLGGRGEGGVDPTHFQLMKTAWRPGQNVSRRRKAKNTDKKRSNENSQQGKATRDYGTARIETVRPRDNSVIVGEMKRLVVFKVHLQYYEILPLFPHA